MPQSGYDGLKSSESHRCWNIQENLFYHVNQNVLAEITAGKEWSEKKKICR